MINKKLLILFLKFYLKYYKTVELVQNSIYFFKLKRNIFIISKIEGGKFKKTHFSKSPA
ncbi:Hypothetical Protein MfeM64YM_0914 [Mycoplasmopsis fermentans M64]|uniref:Uncharacterized protein n=1 Tax=Mycoplasmopsis fermentans (strain M64) TaxID=943945 RepID=A0AB32XCZ9_MYCFM|nr:Hypothetical Protein MfeM64YM_0914 [Mycoplasmopsis fermentans M64]